MGMIINHTRPDETLEAVREKLRSLERSQPQRGYLGASSIGHPCERKSWYYYHMPHLRQPLNDVGHLAVNCGHRSEDVMAHYLRMVDGVELVTECDGQQIGFSDFGGKFKGHIDGIIRGLIQAPKTVHVFEHKSANHKKFANFQNLKQKHGEKQVLQEWDIVYYGQAQIYMHYMELSRHYMTVSLAGVRDFDSCRTEYNKQYALNLIAKAKRVIEFENPPIRLSDKPDHWLCRFCDFAGECHGN
jgi:hypothetical protein